MSAFTRDAHVNRIRGESPDCDSTDTRRRRDSGGRARPVRRCPGRTAVEAGA